MSVIVVLQPFIIVLDLASSKRSSFKSLVSDLVAMTAGPAAGPAEAGFWRPKPFPGMRVDRDFMWIDFDEEDNPMNAIQRRRVKAYPPVDFVRSAL